MWTNHCYILFWKISKNKGFPTDTLGIIGVTVSPVNNQRVWAIVENKDKLLKPILSRFCDIYIPLPIINKQRQSLHQYNLEVLTEVPKDKKYSVVIAAVAHRYFIDLTKEQWKNLITPNGILMDFKGVIPRDLSPLRI